jgi:hypothetical protein
LETPLRDLSGDIIYEENNRGQLVPARRYSPEFWRDKYEAFRLIQDVKQVSLRKEPVVPLPSAPPQRKNGCRFAGTTNGPNCARSCALLHQQTAQPRQSRHHHRGRAGAGLSDRNPPALLR